MVYLKIKPGQLLQVQDRYIRFLRMIRFGVALIEVVGEEGMSEVHWNQQQVPLPNVAIRVVRNRSYGTRACFSVTAPPDYVVQVVEDPSNDAAAGHNRVAGGYSAS